MMNIIMDHITKNKRMHEMMMAKMMVACESDSSKMMGVYKMTKEDEGMRSTMMKIRQWLRLC